MATRDSGTRQLLRLQQRLQEEIKRRTAAEKQVTQLEDTAFTRTRELAEARQEAVEAQRAKSTFLANMSHELRTPLNRILGYAELVIEEAEERKLDDLLEDLNGIHDSAEQLRKLIDGLMDLSKIDQGKLTVTWEPVVVSELFDELAEQVQADIQQNGNQLVVTCGSEVGKFKSDRGKVRRAMLNLLGNAARFTQDGTVTLAAVCETRNGLLGVAMSISDTGMGMSESDLERLWKPFAQGDESTTRQFGGTGLGMALAQRYITVLAGEMTAESQPGAGTCFTVWLPCNPLAQPEIPQEGTRRTVMIVEDSAMLRETMQRLLEAAGFTVVAVSTATDALLKSHANPPAAIVLDMELSGGGGRQGLELLRGTPNLQKIPVVAVASVADMGQAATLGANDFVTTPIDWDHLIELVKKHAN